LVAEIRAAHRAGAVGSGSGASPPDRSGAGVASVFLPVEKHSGRSAAAHCGTEATERSAGPDARSQADARGRAIGPLPQRFLRAMARSAKPERAAARAAVPVRFHAPGGDGTRDRVVL